MPARAGCRCCCRCKRAWNLAIVSVIIAIIVVGLLFWSGFSVAQQINDLVRALNQQLHALEQGMAEIGVAPSADAGASPIGHLSRLLFPNPHQLFGEARNAFTLAVGGIGQAAHRGADRVVRGDRPGRSTGAASSNCCLSTSG